MDTLVLGSKIVEDIEDNFALIRKELRKLEKSSNVEDREISQNHISNLITETKSQIRKYKRWIENDLRRINREIENHHYHFSKARKKLRSSYDYYKSLKNKFSNLKNNLYKRSSIKENEEEEEEADEEEEVDLGRRKSTTDDSRVRVENPPVNDKESKVLPNDEESEIDTPFEDVYEHDDWTENVQKMGYVIGRQRLQKRGEEEEKKMLDKQKQPERTEKTEPLGISDLILNLRRSRHNNVHLSKPFLKSIKLIRKPKDMYIYNVFMDEDISHEVQSSAVKSLKDNQTSLVGKLKLLDGWLEHGNYDYPSLILILSHLNSTMREASFFHVLQMRPTIMEIYINHIEQQLEPYWSEKYFTRLKNLYTFLGRVNDRVYLQLRFSLYEQKKNRLRSVDERYELDIQNFNYTRNLIDDLQKKECHSLKKKRNLEEDNKEEVFSKEEEKELEDYETETQKTREQIAKKKFRIEFVNRLKRARDKVKSKRAKCKKLEKEKKVIGMYINLIDRERQIEVLDSKYNMTQEQHEAFLEKEAEEKKKRSEEEEEEEDEGEEEEDEEEVDIIENKILVLDPFGKEYLFKKYPRECIYNLTHAEFFKYLLFYHFEADEEIVSPNKSRREFNFSQKYFNFLSLDARSKMGDWDSVSQAIEEASKEAGKGSALTSPFTGIDYGSIFRITKQSNVLHVRMILDVVSKYCPPRYIMHQILRSMVSESDHRFIHSKHYQCFKIAVEASEDLPLKARQKRLESLKKYIILELYREEDVKNHPLMKKIDYYIGGGKVLKEEKKKRKSWFKKSKSAPKDE